MKIDPFHVCSFSAQTLFEALSSESCSSEEVANQDRAKYLLGYLQDIGVRSMVVENDYTDGDYLEDFASYYVRCFKNYSRKCKRLHFFTGKFNKKQFESFILNQDESATTKAFKQTYRGFVVARPLPNAIVGRTVLSTYDEDSGRRNYTVLKKYSANLFGAALTIRSLAFQEQDSVLAACATVALWCAFHKTAELFGTASPRPAEITRIASGIVNEFRPIPSHGLSLSQMAHAVRAVGLEPEFVETAGNVPLVSLAYAHLKFGLPVILVVQVEGEERRHAVTLVGYSIKDKPVHRQEVAAGEKCIPMVGLRIDEFYCHDDQIGPFARLIVKPSTADYPVQFEGEWKDKSTGKRLALKPIAVLIPVYNKIRVTFMDVQKWLELLSDLLTIVLPATATLEWDLHLTTTNNYKQSLASDPLPPDAQMELLFEQQPRFIWRAILISDGQRLFEILADATDMARSFPLFKFIWHNDAFKAAFKLVLTSPRLKKVLTELLRPRFMELLLKSV